MYKQQAVRRADSIRVAGWTKRKNGVRILGICILEEGTRFEERMRFVLANNVRKSWKKTSVVRSIFWGEKGSLVGSLMWPWGVFGQFHILFWAGVHFGRLLSPWTSRFLVLVSSSSSAQMLSTLKFFSFSKTQPKILNYSTRGQLHSSSNNFVIFSWLFRAFFFLARSQHAAVVVQYRSLQLGCSLGNYCTTVL